MRTRVLIKTFDAEENERKRWILGDLRLVIPRYRDQFSYLTIPDDNLSFSLDPNLSAETWISRPRAVKKWVAFQAIIVHKKSATWQNEYVTSARFKLGDENSWYHWNGAAWVIDANAWNTEAEISGNITTFPVTARSMRVRVNLATTNAKYAPELRQLKFAYEANFDQMDDYVLRSFVRKMKTIRPLSRYETTSTVASNNFAVRVDAPYTIRGGSSAFDLTADPDELNDLFDTWFPGSDFQSGNLRTSTEIPAGHKVRFYFEHEPTIAHTTAADFVEINGSPSIAITKVEKVGRGLGKDECVINVSNQTGVKVPAPQHYDIVISLLVTTSKQYDIWQIGTAITEMLGIDKQLVSLATDEIYSLVITDPLESTGTRGNRDTFVAAMTVAIQMAVLYERDHKPAFGLKAIKVTGGNAKFEV